LVVVELVVEMQMGFLMEALVVVVLEVF